MVSVITVVKDDRIGLEKTIESVGAQEYPNLEYIIVDGVSSDGTLEVIEQNEHLISTWVSEADAGLYDAMNKGKALANGDRVLFLNAGDVFAAEDALERLLTPPPVGNDVVFGNVVLSRGSTQWHRPPRKNGKALVFDGYKPHHQSILYPRTYFEENDYDLQFRVVADNDYTTRAVAMHPTAYRDVTLVVSTLGGFTFDTYRSVAHAKTMYRERLAYFRKHDPSFSTLNAVFLALLVTVKYLSVKIGGVSLAARVMSLKIKLAFLGKYR